MKIVTHTPEGAIVAFADADEFPLEYVFTISSLPQPIFAWGAWDTMVWPVSVYLGSYLETHRAELVSGRRIVELGAGCGVPGMACARLGASEVILTEYGDDGVEWLQGQICRNFDAGVPRALKLDWTDAESVVKLSEQSIDLILAADCISSDVYGKEAWMALARTLWQLLRVQSAHAQALVACQKRGDDGVDAFLAHAKEKHSLACALVDETDEFVMYSIRVESS